VGLQFVFMMKKKQVLLCVLQVVYMMDEKEQIQHLSFDGEQVVRRACDEPTVRLVLGHLFAAVGQVYLPYTRSQFDDVLQRWAAG